MPATDVTVKRMTLGVLILGLFARMKNSMDRGLCESSTSA